MTYEDYEPCRRVKADAQRMFAGRDEAGVAEIGTDKFLLLGRSDAFTRMIALIDKLAKVQAPLLIEGETGTGKEMAARAIHYRGTRRDQAFVPINCGAIPDNLVESELFGHVKGAFTDARMDRPGLVETAARGTLFLDEVDALTPRAQVTLLRFLQDGSYRPIGARVERKADVRIIAATNSRLEDLVKTGAFRADLLYRLRILAMKLPPLREREDDVALLANAFFERCKKQFPCNAREIDQRSCSWFRSYSWPGNVRELEGLVYSQAVICDEITLKLACPVEIDPGAECAARNRVTNACTHDYSTYSSAKSAALEQFEQEYLRHLMTRAHGNVSQAARLAGKERRALGKLLKKHGIRAREL
jgi:DNA-binding NtrC family response regulator